MSKSGAGLKSRRADMEAAWITAIVVTLLATLHTGHCSEEEKRLVRKLLEDYETNVRPVEVGTEQILVTMDFALSQILDLDERNQALSACFWWRMSWTDYNMKWNPADYGNIESVRISVEHLWIPDITLYNDVSDTRMNLEQLYPAVVFHDGRVRWNTPRILRSSCTLDVTYFPWDEQHCPLEFGSWTYDGNSLDVTNQSATGEMAFFLGDGEWTFKAFPARRRVEYYPDPFPSVIYTIIVQRKPLYYLINIVLPCVFISFCGVLVFLLPPDSGEKVSMSVTLLLASTVFLLIVSEIMPPQSDVVPLIGLYLLVAILLMALSTIMTVVVLNAHHRTSLGMRAPPLLRWLVLKLLASMVCLRGTVIEVLKEGPATESQVTPVVNAKDPASDPEVPHEPEPERYRKEWMMVAMVLDRVFLLAFLTITTIVTLVILLDRA